MRSGMRSAMRRVLALSCLALLAGCPTPAERGEPLPAAGASGASGTAGASGGGDAGAAGGSGTGGAGGGGAGSSGSSGQSGAPAFTTPGVGWARVFSSAMDDAMAGVATWGSEVVAVGTFKAPLVLGDHTWTPSGQQAVFVARLASEDGAVTSSAMLTATGFANAFAVAVDPVGRVYVVGHLSGGPNVVPKPPGFTLPPVAKNNTGFVARVGVSGTFELAKTFPASGDQSSIASVAPLPNGAIVAGTFRAPLELGASVLTPVGGIDAFVARLDEQGAVTWAVQLGGPGDEISPSVSIRDGNVYVAASCSEDLVVKGGSPEPCEGLFFQVLDLAGTPVFRRTYAVAEVGFPTILASHVTDDLWLTGQFTGKVSFGGPSLASGTNSDVFAARLGPDGGHRGSVKLGDGGAQLLRSAAIDPKGRLVLAGGTRGVIDVGKSKLVPTPNDQNAYVLALDSGLTAPWGIVVPSDGLNQTQLVQGVDVDEQGAVYAGATLRGTVMLGGSPYASTGGSDAFVFQLAP